VFYGSSYSVASDALSTKLSRLRSKTQVLIDVDGPILTSPTLYDSSGIRPQGWDLTDVVAEIPVSPTSEEFTTLRDSP
jgi:hypothetical protein